MDGTAGGRHHPALDARQCAELVRQRVPFVCPGKQVYLPFLAFVALNVRKARMYGEYLSPGAQALAVTVMRHPELIRLTDLQQYTGMTASSVSRALEELQNRGTCR